MAYSHPAPTVRCVLVLFRTLNMSDREDGPWQITASSETHRLEQERCPAFTNHSQAIHTYPFWNCVWMDIWPHSEDNRAPVRKSWVYSSLFSLSFISLWFHQHFTVNTTFSICLEVWVISKGARMHSCVTPFHFCHALELEDRVGFLKLLRVEIPSLKCKPLKWKMFHSQVDLVHLQLCRTLQQSSAGT